MKQDILRGIGFTDFELLVRALADMGLDMDDDFTLEVCGNEIVVFAPDHINNRVIEID